MVEIVVREFTKLKNQYGRTMRRAVFLAILIHILLFVLSPPFEFRPYRMAQAEQFQVVDIPNKFSIPDPPKDVEPPREIIAASDDDGVDDVPPTTFHSIDDLPAPPTIDNRSQTAFHAFDEIPELVRFVAPEYPQLAREAGMEGTVEIKVLVGSDGKVKHAEVIYSDVTEEMDRAVLDAVGRAFFRPARQRHVPVPATVVMTYVYRLTD